MGLTPRSANCLVPGEPPPGPQRGGDGERGDAWSWVCAGDTVERAEAQAAGTLMHLRLTQME